MALDEDSRRQDVNVAPLPVSAHSTGDILRTEPPRTQPERPALSTDIAAPGPLLIGPVELPGLLRGLAYLDQYDSGGLAVRITCVDGKLGNDSSTAC